jgi:hypothetical protein
MAEELLVDVTYRGLELGAGLKLVDIGPTTAFLHHTAPMPVGAILELRDGDTPIPVRVSRIWEPTANADHEPGMRVVLEAVGGQARQWWEARISTKDPAAAGDEAPAEAVSDEKSESKDEVPAEAASAESKEEAPAEAASADSKEEVPAEAVSDDKSESKDEAPAEVVSKEKPASKDEAKAKGAARSNGKKEGRPPKAEESKAKKRRKSRKKKKG